MQRLSQLRMFCTNAKQPKYNTLTLFVTNLPWTVGKKELAQHFTKFGPLEHANVTFNKQTGFSQGYGFVTFSFSHSYVKAIQTEHHMIDGTLINVEQAKYDKKQSNYKVD